MFKYEIWCDGCLITESEFDYETYEECEYDALDDLSYHTEYNGGDYEYEIVKE